MLQRAADLAGMSTDQIAKWRDGKSRAPFAPLAILCREAGVSMDWLASGRGAMEIGGVAEPEPVSMLTKFQDLILVPMLNVIGSAGFGAENNGVEEIRQIPFSRMLLRRFGVKPENAHFITGRGDSMLPTIKDGQPLLIDVGAKRVVDGGIYAITIGDDLLIKRIQRSVDGTLTLKSDNPAYEPEVLSPADVDRVRLEGRVFWKDMEL